MTIYWLVESIEDGRVRPNGRFSRVQDATKWAKELATLKELTLVWKGVKRRGHPEERTFVARFQRETVPSV